jgi:anaphase-promoting complex subunit 10
MTEVLRVEVDQPMGWINCPLSIISADGDLQPFRAYFMQIRVLTMHQNGRDTHIRGCKVFGPCYPMHIDKTLPPFTSDEFTHLSTIR